MAGVSDLKASAPDALISSESYCHRRLRGHKLSLLRVLKAATQSRHGCPVNSAIVQSHNIVVTLCVQTSDGGCHSVGPAVNCPEARGIVFVVTVWHEVDDG